MVTALTVNYNTPELLEKLIVSFRKFYSDTPMLVVDGSDKTHYERVKKFNTRFNVSVHHFEYNIHHGPGMAYGIVQITTDQILLIDTDITVIRGGFIEDLQSKLLPTSYGIGDISKINRDGVNVAEYGFDYLHPSLALINRIVALSHTLPIKHGAPMISAMESIKGKGLIQQEPWVSSDLINSLNNKNTAARHYINHDWSGTVSRTGGINL